LVDNELPIRDNELSFRDNELPIQGNKLPIRDNELRIRDNEWTNSRERITFECFFKIACPFMAFLD